MTNNNEEIVLDLIGQPILVGSFISYGSLIGRAAGLQIGKVIAIKIVVPENSYDSRYRITVQGIEFRTWRKPNWNVLRKGTLLFPNRIVVLDPAKIPSEVLSLLDNAEQPKSKKKN